MRQYHNPNKGAVKLAQNYTEYASNDGSGGTAAGVLYNTGMVNGEEGANVVAVVSNITTMYSSTRYKVTFKRAILPTDVLILEFCNEGKWMQQWPIVYQGQACYGAGIIDTPEDLKSIYVAFGNAGLQTTTVSGYATASINPWSGSTSVKWRVRKVSQGNFAESPQINPSITVDGAYTVQHGIETVNVNASEASILLNSMIPSDRVTIRKLGSDATKYITITPPTGCTIEGLSEYRLYEQYASVTIERISETAFVTVGYNGGDLNVTGNLSVTGNSYFPEIQWDGKILGANQNLNTYLTGGMYRQQADAYASLALNYPVAMAGAGVLMVLPSAIGSGSAGVTQVYYQYRSPGAMWRRWGDGVGTWSPWYQMIDSSNISNYSAPYYTAILPYTSLTYSGGIYIYTLPTIAVGAYTKIFVKILNTYYLSIQVNLRFPSGTVHNAIYIKMGQNTGGGKRLELTSPIDGGKVLFETVGYRVSTGSTLYIVGEYVRSA